MLTSSRSLASPQTIQQFCRFASTEGSKRATMIPGDGIGKEISESVMEIFAAAKAPVEWDVVNLSTQSVLPGQPLLSQEVIDSINRNGYGLKGPLATPIGKGHPSLNLTLRKTFGLFANVRPALSIPGFKAKYDNIDLITIRENTEGEYCGLEHEVVPGLKQSMKVITRDASLRVAHHAFKVADQCNRKKVTAIHKANIMRLSDGLFLDSCREAAARYPHIQFDEMSLDAAVMELVRSPSRLDVMVLPNLYGDIISDLCAGLIGGLGLTPSGNFGTTSSIFEAVHGTAPDIAGQNKANPTALLLSGVMMLRDMGYTEHAQRIEAAVLRTIGEGRALTGDLGGKSTTSEFTRTIISLL